MATQSASRSGAVIPPAMGLSKEEAERRLMAQGPNSILDRGGLSVWSIFGDQLNSSLMWLLAIAAVLSCFLGDPIDALAIAVILILNIGIGFAQEYRADRSMEALRKIAVSRCDVLRSGRFIEIDPRCLVVGDLIALNAGARIPADSRLIESANLRVEEAGLTGESEPVDKTQRDPVYLGTTVVAGRGLAEVTATGMSTELGRIAESIQKTREGPTPLQRRLETAGRGLSAAAAGVVAVFFVIGLTLGEPLKLIFMTSVSMAVAAVPEGLPAVITGALAIAARRMLNRRALVRKLTAVEALGSVTVICSDKTGTLTKNEMSVAALALADKHESLFWTAAALCNDAYLIRGGGEPKAAGDPTEAALIVGAAKAGLMKPELDAAFPRTAEAPFDPGRKRMSTVHEIDRDRLPAMPAAKQVLQFLGQAGAVFAKGSSENLMRVCTSVMEDGRVERLTDRAISRIQTAEASFAAKGMRVIACAYRPLEGNASSLAPKDCECGLIFLGLAGLIDPPRPEVAKSIQSCLSAGIRIVMITGDHPLTAQSVAKSLGFPPEGRVITGHDLMTLSNDALERIVDEVAIYARVSPEQKLRIVGALQARGHIVAMTGDGVNDGPALKKADIGVAMGITGTDVAKQVASMVLLDDHFGTIVAAVREGRVVYDNIRKFLKFLMTTNVAELGLMLLAPLAGMPLALTPLQLLWINLLTDGLPALALGLESAEADVMKRPPRPPNEALFDRKMIAHISWCGALMTAVSLIAAKAASNGPSLHWRSQLLMTVVLIQMAHVLAIRSDRPLSPFSRSRRPGNPALWAAIGITISLQFAVTYAPSLQRIFQTEALSLPQLWIAAGCSAAIFMAVEIEKRLMEAFA